MAKWTRRRRRSDAPRLIALGVVALGLVAAFAWWRTREPPNPDPLALPSSTSAGEAARSSVGTDRTESVTIDLPELDASDEVVRRLAVALSEHPKLTEWLASDDLIRRTVSAVVGLAAGRSPAEPLPFLEPEGEIVARDSGTVMVLEPQSYRRYDLLTATFVSVETEAAVRLYRQLLPLFEEAFTELGIPETTFQDMTIQAIDNLLAAPLLTEPPMVESNGNVYRYADPALEDRSAAEKHIMRLGPENGRRVQEKLRDLRAGIVASRP